MKYTHRFATTSRTILALSLAQIGFSVAWADSFVDGGQTTISSTSTPSTWSVIGNLFVGNTGEGTLLITNGGKVTGNSTIHIGQTTTSKGTVIVEGIGSSLHLDQELYIGMLGEGNMIVRDGATVTSYDATSGNTIFVGDRWASTTSNSATLTIKDSGSSLIAGALYVNGSYSDRSVWATVNIENGGKIISDNVSIIGQTGSGRINVNGAGSTWIAHYGIGVADSSEGIMTITQGGQVFADVNALIGIRTTAANPAKGTVIVADSGSLFDIANGPLYVGFRTDGSMAVENGARVNAAESRIGHLVNSIGSAVVTDSGSTWNNSSTLRIGGAGTGSLTIAKGAVVNSVGTTYIAADATSTGTLNIGAGDTQAAVAPGSLNAAKVEFGTGKGRIVFNHTATDASNYVFASPVSGVGAVDSYSGVTTLTGTNTYTGATTVYGGTLKAGAANVFSTASAHDIQADGALDLAGYNQNITNVSNAGTIKFNGAPGTTLTTTNYVGNGGTLVLNTTLGNDSSPSDKLVIDGGSATGTSLVSILNSGGAGAQTTADGIMVVEANNGATTSASAFSLSGRVAAGAYNYHLYQGGNAATGGNANDQNWYLRSTLEDVPAVPATPESRNIPEPKVDYRSEVPLWSSVTPVAMEYGYAMLDTLHERSGALWTVPSANVPEDQDTGYKGWVRLIGDHGSKKNNDFMNHGADYDYDFTGLQTGIDLYDQNEADNTKDKAGVYFGYGNINSDVNGAWSGNAGSIDMDAYTIGSYWTHKAPQGWYTDAVIQGTWYSAETNSVEGQKSDSDGVGFLASLEGGHAFDQGNGFAIEPQAQIAYQNVSFDEVSDQYGKFNPSTGESLRGRLGVRLAKTWVDTNGAKSAPINAWVRANVWHEFMSDPSTTVSDLNGGNSVQITSSYGGTWGELGLGFSGQIAENIILYATGAYNQSLDSQGRKGWDGRLGLKVQW